MKRRVEIRGGKTGATLRRAIASLQKMFCHGERSIIHYSERFAMAREASFTSTSNSLRRVVNLVSKGHQLGGASMFTIASQVFQAWYFLPLFALFRPIFLGDYKYILLFMSYLRFSFYQGSSLLWFFMHVSLNIYVYSSFLQIQVIFCWRLEDWTLEQHLKLFRDYLSQVEQRFEIQKPICV